MVDLGRPGDRHAWLRELVARSDPGHPWNAMLRSGRTRR